MATGELDRLGIEAYLARYRDKSLLRFLTCGSVDDGKSTLIGRLLHDAAQVFDDQLAAVVKDSRKYGTTGEEVDFALLVDGLQAEREQGITIDVAYRYFGTDRRKFIIADTPGHVQYTRNMVTGASHCDLAILLVDARKGVLEQTRRHAFLATLLGIQHLVVAVNKMDLVGWDEQVFLRIRDEFAAFAARLQVKDLYFLPVSAVRGENVVHGAPSMPWFRGAPLLAHLENVHVAGDRNLIDLRFPVQLAVRPDLDYRGYAGTVASGVLRQGDEVVALPSGRRARVAGIDVFGGSVAEAFAGMAVTVRLDRELDVSRGEQLAHVQNVPHVGHEIEAMLVWMGEEPMQPGGRYVLQHTTNATAVTVAALRYRIDVTTLHRAEATALQLNEIGRVRLTTLRPLCWDPYTQNRRTGAFIVVDRLTNATVGAGMILERATADDVDERQRAVDAGTNIGRHGSRVPPAVRHALLRQTPFVVWLTGLPRAGKTTLALLLEEELLRRGHAAHVLTGGELRHGLSRDLGFSTADRQENLRRAAEVARISADAGLIAICAFVSPLAADRALARGIVGAERFFEVHCAAPLAACAARDPEGLYAGAREGRIANVTGVDAPYEPPAAPDLMLATDREEPPASLARLLAAIEARGLLRRPDGGR